MFDIAEELKKLPDRPGVYIMKDSDEQIIYVGKAKNLKNRVRQYFQSKENQAPKVKAMTEHIKEFEYIVTDTEVEALILENNLIKKHMPKYNILLKDDKTYPYIKLTTNEPFPRLYMTRRHEKDKAKYYGPYTSSNAVKETLDLLQKLVPMRRCKKKISENNAGERPCLNYHIGNCKAPCNGSITKEEYAKMVDFVMEFMSGKHEAIFAQLTKQMEDASENMEYEKAADLRDKMIALKNLDENQKIDNLSTDDRDVIAFARANGEALVQIFFIRMGKMIGREHFLLNGVELMTREEVMTDFVKQFYSGTAYIPKEIVVQTELLDKEAIVAWLSQIKEQKVTITVPQKGEKERLVQLAAKNAIVTLEQFGERMKRENERTKGAVDEIREALNFTQKIERIEAYDISNTQGVLSVGSMVVFEDGKPKRSDYRKFKIKSVFGPNDYASMQEVLTRRFNRYKKEMEENVSEGKFNKLPDIIFMDGGKGQVSVARHTLGALNLNIPVCGMIKDDKHRTRGLIYENEEISLKPTSEAFKLITRIQDEVHRFAIEYHRTLRDSGQLKSVLDEVNGIGAERRKGLMKYFGTIEKIKEATEAQLAEAPGMNKKAAASVYQFFHRLNES